MGFRQRKDSRVWGFFTKQAMAYLFAEEEELGYRHGVCAFHYFEILGDLGSQRLGCARVFRMGWFGGLAGLQRRAWA
jgi:hypothetical protein